METIGIVESKVSDWYNPNKQSQILANLNQWTFAKARPIFVIVSNWLSATELTYQLIQSSVTVLNCSIFNTQTVESSTIVLHLTSLYARGINIFITIPNQLLMVRRYLTFRGWRTFHWKIEMEDDYPFEQVIYSKTDLTNQVLIQPTKRQALHALRVGMYLNFKDKIIIDVGARFGALASANTAGIYTHAINLRVPNPYGYQTSFHDDELLNQSRMPESAYFNQILAHIGLRLSLLLQSRILLDSQISLNEDQTTALLLNHHLFTHSGFRLRVSLSYIISPFEQYCLHLGNDPKGSEWMYMPGSNDKVLIFSGIPCPWYYQRSKVCLMWRKYPNWTYFAKDKQLMILDALVKQGNIPIFAGASLPYNFTVFKRLLIVKTFKYKQFKIQDENYLNLLGYNRFDLKNVLSVIKNSISIVVLNISQAVEMYEFGDYIYFESFYESYIFELNYSPPLKPNFEWWSYYRNFDIDKYQNDALGYIDTIKVNMFDYRIDARLVFLGLFSISNDNNSLQRVFDFARTRFCCFLYPSLQVFTHLEKWNGNSDFDVSYVTEGDTLITNFNGIYYRDKMISNFINENHLRWTDPYVFTSRGYETFWNTIRSKNKNINLQYINSSTFSKWINPWNLLHSPRLFKITANIQSLEMNFLEIIKYVSAIIYYGNGVPIGEHYWIRRLALIRKGGIMDLEHIGNGDGWNSNKTWYGYVSGHIIAVLMMASYSKASVRSFLDAKVYNLRLNSGDINAVKLHKLLELKNEAFTESGTANVDGLWHSYLEDILGIDTVKNLQSSLNLSVETVLFSKIEEKLLSLSYNYPNYLKLSDEARRDAKELRIDPEKRTSVLIE